MKIIRSAAAVLLALALCNTGAVPAGAAEQTYGNLKYTIQDDHVIIKGLTAYTDVLEIPAEIEGYPVTEIGERAFYSVSAGKIIIPEGVTRIGMFAFSGGKVDETGATENQPAAGLPGDKLTEIILPDTLTYIGNRAFFDCDGLKSVIIPKSVPVLYDSTFYSCDALTEAVIGAETVGNLAFSECKALTSVTLEEGVKNIGYNAFTSTGLESIRLPQSVRTIGENAFSGTPLVNGQSDAVKYADDWAVACNSGVSSVTIAEGTRGMANKLFFSCASLKSIVIPEGVEIIGSNVFGTALAEISLPESLKFVGEAAFALCSPLKTVTFPANMETVAANQFIMCTKLETVVFENPDTDIGMLAGTIPEKTVIYGYTGSTAQTYAETFDRSFVSLGFPPAGMFGDVNRNGEIDTGDASMLLRYIAESGAGTVTVVIDLKIGDINSSGGIEPADAALLLRYIAECGANGTQKSLEEFVQSEQ